MMDFHSSTVIAGLTFEAVTSAQKARARRLEAQGLVSIQRELDSRVLRVRGRPTLVTREIYYVEPKAAALSQVRP